MIVSQKTYNYVSVVTSYYDVTKMYQEMFGCVFFYQVIQ